MKLFKGIIWVLSGEFILKWCANDGGPVLFRTVWTSASIYLLAVALKSFSSGGIFLTLSWPEFLKEVNETLPWIGAILAATYAAFYTRFASQWKYVADLYNQQMSLAVTLSEENLNGENYRAWQAAFIEDAIRMHLATKIGFKNAIGEMLKEDALYNLLCKHVDKDKVDRLKTNKTEDEQ